MKTWKKIKNKKTIKTPRFNFLIDEVFGPDGVKRLYYHIKSPKSVAIVPFDGKKIYLINEYRYTVARREWELPAGKAESNNMLKEAKRELKEETGFTAKKWTRLGTFNPTNSTSNTEGIMFLAEDLIKGKHQREGTEADMIMKGFTPAQVKKMILSGKITDVWATVPFFFFLAKKNMI